MAANFWTLRPDQIPWIRQAIAMEWEGESHEEHDIGRLEILEPDGHGEACSEKFAKMSEETD